MERARDKNTLLIFGKDLYAGGTPIKSYIILL